MQQIGNMIRENLTKFVPNLKLESASPWTHMFEQHIKSNIYGKIVVSDVRYPDESDLIKKYHGIIVKIVRPNNPNEQTGLAAIHSSETEGDSITPHFTIMNDGSLADLHKKLDLTIQVIMLNSFDMDANNDNGISITL